MELTKVQFITWTIRYTAIILFIISFSTEYWFEYNNSEYSHYGLWHSCEGGSSDCGEISKCFLMRKNSDSKLKM